MVSCSPIKTIKVTRSLSDYPDFSDSNVNTPVVSQTFNVERRTGKIIGSITVYNYLFRNKEDVLPGQEEIDTNGQDCIVRYVQSEINENGWTTEFNEDGTWRYRVHQQEGKKNGLGIRFLPDGKERLDLWKDDQKIYTVLTENKEKNGGGVRFLPNGKQVLEFWKHDKLVHIVLAENGKQNGPGVTFLPNGEKVYEKWKDGQLVKDDATLRAEWQKRKIKSL